MTSGLQRLNPRTPYILTIMYPLKWRGFWSGCKPCSCFIWMCKISEGKHKGTTLSLTSCVAEMTILKKPSGPCRWYNTLYESAKRGMKRYELNVQPGVHHERWRGQYWTVWWALSNIRRLRGEETISIQSTVRTLKKGRDRLQGNRACRRRYDLGYSTF